MAHPETGTQAPQGSSYMPRSSVEHSPLTRMTPEDTTSFYANRPTQPRLPTPNSLHIPSTSQVRRQSDAHIVDFTVQGHEHFTIPARQSVPTMANSYPVTSHVDTTIRHNSYPIDSNQQDYYLNINMQEPYMAQMMSLNSEIEFMGQGFSSLESIFQDPTYLATLQQNF